MIAPLAFVLGPARAQDDSWRASLGDPREILEELREEVVRIPLRGATAAEKAFPLTGTLYRPAGAGPFPVLILNHGSPAGRSGRDGMGRYRLIPQTREWLRLGFAVLVPMRRGYGASPGDVAEGGGSCERPRFARAGKEAARDVLSAVDFVRTRATLDPSRVVLMGQSAGGFAAMAAASEAPQGVLAVLNFAGGRLGNGRDGMHCAVDEMARTLAAYAHGTRAPVLWFYSENDKYFGPAAVRTWFAAFTAAGGKGRLILRPPFGEDGHLLFYEAESIPIWSRSAQDFLREFAPETLPTSR